MERKLVLIVALAVAVSLFSCNSTVQMLPEPVENKNLLIGSLIFDIDGYKDNFVTIRQNIEVAIIGRFVKDSDIKNFSQWVTTDENGYFFIANVPDGQYAIKGFRTHLIGLGNLIIENELIDPQRNYFELKNSDNISMTGELFDVGSNQRIVNFRHNILTLHRNGIIDNKRYNRLQNVKLSTGEILNNPPVPIYFMEKFEGSRWESYLNLQLN
jgi:hypothetical protein